MSLRWMIVYFRRRIRHAGEKTAQRYPKHAGADQARVEFIRHPTDRSWMRDSGPIFVRRQWKGRTETAIVHFHFNAWAKYPDWKKDRQVPEVVARHLSKRILDAHIGNREFVLEGGGIEVNGRGTLLTTEECYLHPEIQVRNPGLDRKGFEKALNDCLGATNVFWLAGGVDGDDTHGHIDDICRFVDRKTLVLVKEGNPEDANYGPLNENWDRIQDLRLEDGSKPEVIALPMPDPIFFDRDRLPASYANLYIANHAVLVPTFNDPKDRLALGLLGELFKDRIVVGVHAIDLYWASARSIA